MIYFISLKDNYGKLAKSKLSIINLNNHMTTKCSADIAQINNNRQLRGSVVWQLSEVWSFLRRYFPCTFFMTGHPCTGHKLMNGTLHNLAVHKSDSFDITCYNGS